MSQLKSLDLPETGSATGSRAGGNAASGGRWWIWLLVIAIAIGGFWWYRSSHSKAADSAAVPGGAGSAKGKGPVAGGFAVPVVVATAQSGDLPVFFNGLGSVTPLAPSRSAAAWTASSSTVTFKEGQFVKQGDLLAEIDPRPFQVQLEQAARAARQRSGRSAAMPK